MSGSYPNGAQRQSDSCSLLTHYKLGLVVGLHQPPAQVVMSIDDISQLAAGAVECFLLSDSTCTVCGVCHLQSPLKERLPLVRG